MHPKYIVAMIEDGDPQAWVHGIRPSCDGHMITLSRKDAMLFRDRAEAEAVARLVEAHDPHHDYRVHVE